MIADLPGKEQGSFAALSNSIPVACVCLSSVTLDEMVSGASVLCSGCCINCQRASGLTKKKIVPKWNKISCITPVFPSWWEPEEEQRITPSTCCTFTVVLSMWYFIPTLQFKLKSNSRTFEVRATKRSSSPSSYPPERLSGTNASTGLHHRQHLCWQCCCCYKESMDVWLCLSFGMYGCAWEIQCRGLVCGRNQWVNDRWNICGKTWYEMVLCRCVCVRA